MEEASSWGIVGREVQALVLPDAGLVNRGPAWLVLVLALCLGSPQLPVGLFGSYVSKGLFYPEVDTLNGAAGLMTLPGVTITLLSMSCGFRFTSKLP